MDNTAAIISDEEDLNDLSFLQNIKENEILSNEYIYDSIKGKSHTRSNYTEEESQVKENESKTQYSKHDMVFINFLYLISSDWSNINNDNNDIDIVKKIVKNSETKNNENSNKKHNKFKTKKRKERGRKVNSEKILGKKHEKDASDNIQTKIQVHFINFLTDVVNDIVKAEFDSKFLSNLMENNKNDNKKKKSLDDLFRYITYAEKKKISYGYLKDILQKPIKNIITKKVSSKYKNFKDNYNEILYEKLKSGSKRFLDFVNMKYIDVFINYYYNEEKPLKIINFEGKNINLSKNTKAFEDLLIKNKNLKKQIIDEVKYIYLNEYNKSKKFITSKNAL